MIRLVALVVLALAAGLGALLAEALTQGPWTDGLRQALVAGAFIGLGWAAAFLTNEYRRWKDRQEERIDLQLALRAEISDFAARFSEAELVAEREAGPALIRAAGDEPGEARIVFVPRPKPSAIFEAVGDRITGLGADVTDPVIWFYSQIIDVQAFVDDLRSEAFGRLAAERRALAYGDYLEMLIEARRRADYAIEALTDALGDGAKRR